jgi:sulfopyruvate decarboxylase subunit beta
MNLGSLSTIGYVNPQNLTLIVIDNGVYASTGNQKTHTSGKTLLNDIAEGAGIESVLLITEQDEITRNLMDFEEGCHFILIKTEPGNEKLDPIPIDPMEIKRRFMNALRK